MMWIRICRFFGPRRKLNFNCGYISGEEVEKNRPNLIGKARSEIEIKEVHNERTVRIS